MVDTYEYPCMDGILLMSSSISNRLTNLYPISYYYTGSWAAEWNGFADLRLCYGACEEIKAVKKLLSRSAICLQKALMSQLG
jgi:hypothetical protein